jgi:hypothetical protein
MNTLDHKIWYQSVNIACQHGNIEIVSASYVQDSSMRQHKWPLVQRLHSSVVYWNFRLYVVASETSSLRLRAKTQGIGWACQSIANLVFSLIPQFIYNTDAEICVRR